MQPSKSTASVVYAGRALPIGWLVVEGKKGHLAQERHLELVQSIYQLIGPTAPVLGIVKRVIRLLDELALAAPEGLPQAVKVAATEEQL